MKITPLLPDIALPTTAAPHDGDASDFLSAVNAASGTLMKADKAENAFAAGSGGLQEAVFERARADIVVSIASAAASRTAQALNTVLGMQM